MPKPATQTARARDAGLTFQNVAEVATAKVAAKSAAGIRAAGPSIQSAKIPQAVASAIAM